MAKLTPIYRKLNKQQEGYTLLLDQHTRQVYRVDHGSVNQFKFWITWALSLALLRSLKDINMSLDHPLSILIIIILLAISALIGVWAYKSAYKDKREVHYTETMIDYYKDQGRNTFKKEVKAVVYIFAIFIILMVIFLIYGGFIWLFFGLLFFGLCSYIVCGLPPSRFKLYK